MSVSLKRGGGESFNVVDSPALTHFFPGRTIEVSERASCDEAERSETSGR